MTPDTSSVLLRLIDTAERTICVRQTPDVDLAELERAVCTLAQFYDAAALLACALRALDRVRAEDAPASAWRMVIGCLLPLARAELSRVIEARKLTPAADAELPYFHR